MAGPIAGSKTSIEFENWNTGERSVMAKFIMLGCYADVFDVAVDHLRHGAGFARVWLDRF